MALSPRITATVANTMLDAGIGTPANTGKLRIYTGTQPAAGGGSLSGNTLLLECILNTDAFPAASGGVLTSNPLGAAVAVASGTATWFRLLKSDGTTVLLDGSVGEAADTCDCTIDNKIVTTGDVVAVTGLVITQPLT